MIDAATLVRSARERAEMSARDLAARSGVSTSTVTRIERGELNPTVAMLERLVEASGNELVVMVEPRRSAPTMEALRARRDEVLEAVDRFGGSNVRVFGSVARGEAREESDVDLLIDVPAGTGLVAVRQMSDAVAAAMVPCVLLASQPPVKSDVATFGRTQVGNPGPSQIGVLNQVPKRSAPAVSLRSSGPTRATAPRSVPSQGVARPAAHEF